MCKTRTKTLFHEIINFCVGPLRVPGRSQGGPLEVPDVRTFGTSSGDVPGTSRTGWADTHTYVCLSEGKKSSFFLKFGELCFLDTDLVTFTEETLNENFHFLCSEKEF